MFFDIVQGLCDKSGISISKLALDLKISKSNVTNWKNGSSPRADKLEKIAAYFGVSADYLLGNEQKNKLSAEVESLSDIENEILEIFRSLPEDKKQAFMTVARSLKVQSKDK